MVHHVGTPKDSFSSDEIISELCCMTQDGEIQEVCMGLMALGQASKVNQD